MRIRRVKNEEANLINEAENESVLARLHEDLNAWFARYVVPAMDGADLPVTGKGQTDLAGPASFASDWFFEKD